MDKLWYDEVPTSYDIKEQVSLTSHKYKRLSFRHGDKTWSTGDCHNYDDRILVRWPETIGRFRRNGMEYYG